MSSLLDELQAILAKLRYVKAGDIVLSEDHNTQNDALYKIKEILENHETRISTLEQQAPGQVTVEEPDYTGWKFKYKIGPLSNIIVTYGYPHSVFIVDDNANKLYAYVQVSPTGTDVYTEFMLVDLVSGSVIQDVLESAFPIPASLFIAYYLYTTATTSIPIPEIAFSLPSRNSTTPTNKYVVKYSCGFRVYSTTDKFYLIANGLPSVDVFKRGSLLTTLNVYNDTGLYAFNVNISPSGKYIVMLGSPVQEISTSEIAPLTEAYIVVYESY